MDKNITEEKITFVLHKIVAGAVYHGAFTFLFKVQNNALKLKSQLLSLLVYFVPILLLGWFFDINRKKNTWKPFGKYSDALEVIIILITMIVLYFTIGII
ncbi:hypothetical protein NBE98_11000 [Clostridium swellfunianum]|uniref:hypothetical protein n=1 Tax=Clostridium swellfunianum TaxID=1367462 RepID=UPI00202E749C|nr:hypothetical protein [Clostridium swellfunianum]MCM0648901.1 hypothetical protein [Clostridium swellfunianum]